MSCWALLLAGGTGSRYSKGGLADNKLLVPLQGVPVLAWSVRALLASPSVGGLVVTGANEVRHALQPFLEKAKGGKPVMWAAPGVDRRGSVWSGLQAMAEASAESVLIHDGARPLAGQVLFERILAAWRERREAEGLSGLIAGFPMIDTVKQAAAINAIGVASPQITRTLPRQSLWQVQTPQVFEYRTLCEAHQQVGPQVSVTDDAQLMELAGLGPIGLFDSPRTNVKLTTPADRAMLEALIGLL